jgi:hypothetical protein
MVADLSVAVQFPEFIPLLVGIILAAFKIGPIALHRTPDDVRGVLAPKADGRE